MFDAFIDAVFSRNIFALIIVVLMIIIGVKLLYTTGKGVFLLICFAALAGGLYYFFPDFVASILMRMGI